MRENPELTAESIQTSQRKRTFRFALGQLAFFVFLPPLALVASLAIPSFSTDIGHDEAPWAVRGLGTAVAQLGPQAVRDSSWILPSLLALLIAIYVGDYAARDPQDPNDEGEPSSNLRRARLWLSLASSLIGGITIYYMALAVATVAMGKIEPGHLVGIFIVGIWVPIFAVAIGQFASVRLKVQLDNTKKSIEKFQAQLARFPYSVDDPEHPRLKLAVWLAVPLVVAAIALTVSLVMSRNSIAFEIFVVTGPSAFFQACAAVVAICIRQIQANKGDDWALLLFSSLAGSFFAAITFAVTVLYAIDVPFPYGLGFDVALLLMIGFSYVWIAPPTFVRAASAPVWSPSRSVVAAIRAGLERSLLSATADSALLQRKWNVLHPEGSPPPRPRRSLFAALRRSST